MKLKYLLFSLFLTTLTFGQKFTELAKTPPMGWNSWNKFACDVNEDLIKQAADAMVLSGMRDAGYQYIVIDDCWHGERDSLGFIHPDKNKFPSGIKALADYIHSKGLKFGIYSDAGWQTCGGRPGSRGYEFQDAYQYSKWGVDYLKYDWCNTEGLKTEGAYLTMRDALYKAGKPIVFSMCEWGTTKPWEWAKDISHLWRTTTDISPVFEGVVDHGNWQSWSAMKIMDTQVDLRKYAGPGHWNDPDMLEVGNGLTLNENRAHFSMWCMLAAPLMAGNDLSNMSKETIEVLTNKDVISVDQDSLGIQAFRYSQNDSLEIWFKPLTDNNWAMAILNRNTHVKHVDFNWVKENVVDSIFGYKLDTKIDNYNLYDLWKHLERGNTKSPFSAEVQPRDIIMLKLIPTK